MRWLAALELARSIGPWASSKRPTSVRRTEVVVHSERAFRAWAYEPSRAHGALLLIGGLHFLGPADPRLDAFCRTLAQSGQLVLAPFFPDLVAMRLQPALLGDAAAALDALLGHRAYPRGLAPGVMSISFGSRAAIHLGATRPELGRLVTFGGYADFRETMRFALVGAPPRTHDPLNRPAVFLHLLAFIAGVEDPPRLAAGWRAYMERTWGRPHLKVRHAFAPIAEELSYAVAASDRRLFLQGVGLQAGGEALVDAALATAGGAFDFLDPSADARRVACRTWICHGRDDDVIAWEQSELLGRWIPHSELAVTGLYAHTARVARPLGIHREARTMLRILRALTG